jgi:hypothetical protein
MSQKSKKAPTNSSNNSVVHEVNNIHHRIVVLRGGIPKCSPWFNHYELAVLGVYRACCGGNAALPVGIFKVTSVAHEVL